MTTTYILKNPTLPVRSSSGLDYRKELNDAQYQAATAMEGPLLIIAGAGTGKSRTLVYRVAHLIDQGVDPRSIQKQLESAPYTIKSYRIDPVTTRINRLADDVVAISYSVHEDLMVDGKPVGLDAFDTSVWKKTDNGWTCVLHTESIKGDAFGRDRLHPASSS